MVTCPFHEKYVMLIMNFIFEILLAKIFSLSSWCVHTASQYTKTDQLIEKKIPHH
jgi:hypothetical protein